MPESVACKICGASIESQSDLVMTGYIFKIAPNHKECFKIKQADSKVTEIHTFKSLKWKFYLSLFLGISIVVFPIEMGLILYATGTMEADEALNFAKIAYAAYFTSFLAFFLILGLATLWAAYRTWQQRQHFLKNIPALPIDDDQSKN